MIATIARITLMQRWSLGAACIIFLFSLTACNRLTPGEHGDAVTSNPVSGNVADLTITAYNYTDRYIDEFYADGQAGGNVHVSSVDGGGGGSTCCLLYTIGEKDTKVKIRWQRGGCTYDNIIDTDGQLKYAFHAYYKEAEVQVEPNVAKDPKYLEVHFFPDDSVKVAVTGQMSTPRLILEKSRDKNLQPERCPNDRAPKN